MHVLVICKNEEDPIKMKALEWPQHFSHYKPMGILPDAQWKLTPQCIVGLGQNEKKGNKICLFDTPRTVMVNKEMMSEYT